MDNPVRIYVVLMNRSSTMHINRITKLTIFQNMFWSIWLELDSSCPLFVRSRIWFSAPAINVVRRIFLHNVELQSLYRSPNIVRVIKSRRLTWAGHVVRKEEGTSAFKILSGKPIGRRPSGRPGRRWRTILEWIWKK